MMRPAIGKSAAITTAATRGPSNAIPVTDAVAHPNMEKDMLAAKRIAVALAAKGIAVLRFDFTGLGSSEGDFANSTFSSNVADLVRAADHLRETRRSPAILIGHSLG